ncbi:GNAT family N-acetyltransferase [Deinococcus sp. Arct2-2]|uniref:GNAT family N-acetyltransferase n=1 Tax=Deinococcus sp. Arct2-2 TaxID=2568653 RepID=UPI0010A3635B|nr:GNAT family N-acetyltransferase [Deinococcus sp. Arct2-2]THF71849.1 GNAT family N-acetyltransferase [Deinococcus sp. Arct2-2]
MIDLQPGAVGQSGVAAPDLRPITAAEAHLALPALRELRPHAPSLVSAEAFAAHLKTAAPEQYRLAGAFESGREEAAAVAGYRVMTTLAFGRMLYLDDLSTLPAARGRGHALALLRWLETEARRLECKALHLDSGVGPHRFDAHRLYLKAGLNITCHHFEKVL